MGPNHPLDRANALFLWETLDRIQKTLRLANAVMADLLGVTEKEFLRLKLTRRDPSIRSILGLTEVLNITFDAIMERKIDFTALDRQFHGDKAYIPERYLCGAFGKQRIAIDYLSRIETSLGWRARVHVLQHLQLTEAALSDPDALINLYLTTDVLNWILSQYRNEDIILKMGHGVIQSQHHGPIGRALSDARSLRELYEMFFGGVIERYWEKNYLWRVHSVTPSSIRVRGIPNPDLLGIVDEDAIKNSTTCILRQGIMNSIPTFLGFPVGEGRKTACITKGDSFCEFELDVQPLLKNAGPQSRLRPHLQPIQ